MLPIPSPPASATTLWSGLRLWMPALRKAALTQGALVSCICIAMGLRTCAVPSDSLRQVPIVTVHSYEPDLLCGEKRWGIDVEGRFIGSEFRVLHRAAPGLRARRGWAAPVSGCRARMLDRARFHSALLAGQRALGAQGGVPTVRAMDLDIPLIAGGGEEFDLLPRFCLSMVELLDPQHLLVYGCAGSEGTAALLVSADGVWAVPPADWDGNWDPAAPRTPLMTRNPDLPGDWVHHHEAEIFAFLRVELTDP